jgi:hypothetical protein
MMLFKLFFFLRIYKRLSVITTMILTCMSDLKVFMVFFMILCTFFGTMMNVLGPNPQIEYRKLSPFFAGILSCLRISLGDFDFTILEILTGNEARVYWIVWLLAFIMGCLIFLNFIIAEVSDSYARVKSDIGALIYKERATMVKEVEDFLSKDYKMSNKTSFPKYVVVRETEN